MQGKVLAIARRAKTRAPMELVESTPITMDAGVRGDLRGAPNEIIGKLTGHEGNRQVTVLTREGWEAACAALGRDLPWTARRANILVEGLAVAEEAGRTIRIGDAALLITGETEPCERMDQQTEGLRAALTPDWRAGVTCRVTAEGSIAVGDVAELAD